MNSSLVVAVLLPALLCCQLVVGQLGNDDERFVEPWMYFSRAYRSRHREQIGKRAAAQQWLANPPMKKYYDARQRLALYRSVYPYFSSGQANDGLKQLLVVLNNDTQ